MLIKKWIFYIIGIGLSPLVHSKYQVCSITINSSDEIEVFKEHLSPVNFEFVELLPASQESYTKHSSHWFNEACKRDYRCDILVISGHFGGTFFGKSGFTLPTELMEQQSCNKSCSKILSNVKEIFLFGCNTLSDKSKDSRSYEQYLQVLLDDGMARETAERVVAARYSPLEAPFYKRMGFIFSGSQMVYGFDQLSPLGAHIRKPLTNYFKAISKTYGSYYKYMKQGLYKRKKNHELFKSLRYTTINQAYLPNVTNDIKDRQFFQNKCILFDDQISFIKRASALQDIFKSNQSGTAFFAIEHFLEQHQTQMIEGEGRRIFRDLKNNVKFSEKFKSFYRHLNYLPYMKIIYLNILKRFQWITDLDFKVKLKQSMVNLIQNPNLESYMSVNLLVSDYQLEKRKFSLTPKDVPQGYIQNIWSLLILEKLQYEAPHLQQEILNFCYDNQNTQIEFCYQSLNTLAHIKPSKQIALQVISFLDREESGLIFYTLRLLGQSSLLDYATHLKMASFLNHSESWIREEALDALLLIRTPYADIQQQISTILKDSDRELSIRILDYLSQIDIANEKTMSHIIYYMDRYADDSLLFQKGIMAFQNSSQISDFALNYFYNILESKGNSYYILLQILSQMGLKDIGFYYRVIKLLKEPDISIKIKTLNYISSLTWFHPNFQPQLLALLTDDNKKIRYIATQWFQNIQNLTNDTIDRVFSLKGQNPEVDLLIQFLK